VGCRSGGWSEGLAGEASQSLIEIAKMTKGLRRYLDEVAETVHIAVEELRESHDPTTHGAGQSPFDERDVQSGTRAILVNDLFARRYLAPGPIVGRRFANLFRRIHKGVVTEIVGVVAPMLKDGNDSEPQPEIISSRSPRAVPWARA
jgi:hypothetical protein